MKPGDILLFTGEDDFLSKIIAWGTNSKYSHAAILVSSDMDLAIEAIPGKGVRAIDIRKITSSYDVFRIRPEHSFNLDKTISHLVDKLNQRYDFLGVIFLGLIKLLVKVGFPLKNTANQWQIERDYFCSELVFEAFSIGGGLKIVPSLGKAAIISPADIAKSRVLEKI